jgi:hypothetical protein
MSLFITLSASPSPSFKVSDAFGEAFKQGMYDGVLKGLIMVLQAAWPYILIYILIRVGIKLFKNLRKRSRQDPDDKKSSFAPPITSGRMTINFELDVFEKIQAEAKRQGRTEHKIVNEIVDEYFKNADSKPRN